MPKSLCLASLGVSALVLVLFLLDLVSGFPFGRAGGVLVNIIFLALAGGLGTYSWLTFKEQK